MPGELPGESTLSKERPFPGLRPFAPGDHKFFFGRSAQYYALYRLLDLSRFVAVIGNSGSGKSSLVRAGLLPLLDEESREAGGRQWLWTEMRPGDLPLQSLIQTLTLLGERQSSTDDPMIAATRAERIAHHLRGSSHGIAKAIGEMDGIDKQVVVLVVDQFEELFRFASSGSISGIAPREEARLRDEAAHFVQLLLEASRSPTVQVRVLLTMRSDFIGDCAQFQGLPEAVSGTQFLVPSLTRDQREEVIRGPIALAQGSIDPSLVEQLLNDSGAEQDQLPVLQHCMLRLWEQAGQRAAAEDDASPTTGRHISRREYDDIHRMSGALSQHADEILTRDLKGLEPAVASVFRALSDIDRDGRATRRALSFEQLAAETALDEDTLRRVLDRFRSDDCSFLRPSPASDPVLGAATRIDVGHEALLRHWERVSGEIGATGVRGDDRPIGWLREEFRDGQRYQALRAMANVDDVESTLLPLDQVERHWAWWNERPRTPAWAMRYGGGHSRVERMLLDSRDALVQQQKKQRATQKALFAARVLAAILFVFSIIAAGLSFQQYQAASKQRDIADATSIYALQVVSTLLGFVNRQTDALTVDAIRELLGEIKLDDMPDNNPNLMALKAQGLITLSDSLKVVGGTAEALERARQAKELAQRLAMTDAGRMEWLRLSYSSSFRIGDAALALHSPPTLDDIKVAVEEYTSAEGAAEQLYAAEPNRPDRMFDLAFIHNKIGELKQIQKDLPTALARFQSALGFADMAAAVDSANVTRQAYAAATRVKIARIQPLLTPPDVEGALENYSQALSVYLRLRDQASSNNIVMSNLGSAYKDRADLFSKRWATGDSELAVADYSDAIEIFSNLSEKDPTNVFWRFRLVSALSGLGDTLQKAGDIAGAIVQYKKELEIRQWLLSKQPDNQERINKVAETLEKIAKLEGKPGQLPSPAE